MGAHEIVDQMGKAIPPALAAHAAADEPGVGLARKRLRIDPQDRGRLAGGHLEASAHGALDAFDHCGNGKVGRHRSSLPVRQVQKHVGVARLVSVDAPPRSVEI